MPKKPRVHIDYRAGHRTFCGAKAKLENRVNMDDLQIHYTKGCKPAPAPFREITCINCLMSLAKKVENGIRQNGREIEDFLKGMREEIRRQQADASEAYRRIRELKVDA